MDDQLLITPDEVFSCKKDIPVKGRVCHVYDGDTIHIVMIFQGEPIRVVCRLYGIDTPEMTSKENRTNAIIARNRLVQLVTDIDIELHDMIGSKTGEFTNKIQTNRKIIDVVFKGRDKYNRELVDLFVDGRSINSILLAEGHCYEYFGGTKEK